MMKKILIVEDDRDSREALRDLLEAEGCSVITARNGKEGLERAHEVPLPALILVDLTMPVMDGREFLSHLRADPALAPIPAIVVTGSIAAVPENATSLLGKPIDVQKLLAFVNHYC